VYSFGRAALLLLVEVYNHTVPVRERRRIRVNAGQVLKNEALLLLINILSRLTLHNQGTINSGPLNVVRWYLIFVGPQYRAWFM